MKPWRIALRPAVLAFCILGAGVILGVVIMGVSGPASSQTPPASLPGTDQAATSVFDDVDECDLLAAHPSDPERVAEGVADDAIIPRLAMRACEDAARRAGTEPRFTFQLGRAFLAANRRQDAVARFQQAADRDYGAAHAYLGDAYQFGHGVAADSEKALAAYRRAAAKGFSPADGQIEMLTFDPSRYMVPLPALLYRGQTASLADPEVQAVNVYLYGFVTTLAQECQTLLQPPILLRALARRYPANWTPDADATVDVMRTGSAGEYDGKTFLRRHGCDGPVARQMGERLTQLLSSS